MEWLRSPETWQHKNNVLNEWCEKVGRDPADIERTVHLEDKVDAATLDALAEAGATHFIVGLGEPWNYTLVEKLLSWRDSVS